MLSSKYYSKSHAKTQMISIGILRKKCKNMPNGTKGLAVLFPKNGMPIRTVNSIPIYRDMFDLCPLLLRKFPPPLIP